MMIFDGILILTALWLSVILVNPDFFQRNSPENYLVYFLLITASAIVIFYRSGLYRTILLYMGLKSGVVILKGITLITMITSFFVFVSETLHFPVQAILVFWMMSLLMVGGIRFMAKITHQNMIYNFRPREPVIIYGAGSSGMQLLAALNNGGQYLPVAFVDDNLSLVGDTLHGIPVYSSLVIPELIENFSVRQILLAMPSATHAERKHILNALERYPVHVRTVPDLFEMVSGKVRVDEVRDINIEDLLGRDIVPPDFRTGG